MSSEAHEFRVPLWALSFPFSFWLIRTACVCKEGNSAAESVVCGRLELWSGETPWRWVGGQLVPGLQGSFLALPQPHSHCRAEEGLCGDPASPSTPHVLTIVLPRRIERGLPLKNGGSGEGEQKERGTTSPSPSPLGSGRGGTQVSMWQGWWGASPPLSWIASVDAQQYGFACL